MAKNTKDFSVQQKIKVIEELQELHSTKVTFFNMSVTEEDTETSPEIPPRTYRSQLTDDGNYCNVSLDSGRFTMASNKNAKEIDCTLNKKDKTETTQFQPKKKPQPTPKPVIQNDSQKPKNTPKFPGYDVPKRSKSYASSDIDNSSADSEKSKSGREKTSSGRRWSENSAPVATNEYMKEELPKTDLPTKTEKAKSTGHEDQEENVREQNSHFQRKPKLLTEIDLLLIGKTGNGKSALGNTILNRHAFKSKPSPTSVTKKVSYEISEFNGRRLKVVDGPGVGDTDLNEESAANMVVDALSAAVGINPRGYHAFLLVVKFGNRFTREDQQTIELLKKVFGKNFVKKFCILIMTNGDQYSYKISFDEWIQQQSGVLSELVRECNNRIVLFDNRTQDIFKKEKQMNGLMQLIDQLMLDNCRYANDEFELAKSSRDVIFLEYNKTIIVSEIMNEASLILQELQHVQENSASLESLDDTWELKDLLSRTNDLFEDILEKDKNTGFLKEVLDYVQSMQNSIKNEITIVERVVSFQQKWKYLRKRDSGLHDSGSEYRLSIELDQEQEVMYDEMEKLKNHREQIEEFKYQLKKIKESSSASILSRIHGKLFTAFKKKMLKSKRKDNTADSKGYEYVV